jgi:hypothetical protein
MNGRDRQELQNVSGVRPLVDEINNLRVHFGFEAIQVTTPRAEVRARCGAVPAIPLSCVCSFADSSLEILLAPGYPDNASLQFRVIKVGIVVKKDVGIFSGLDNDHARIEHVTQALTTSLASFSEQKYVAVPLVSCFKSLVIGEGENLVSDDDHHTTSSMHTDVRQGVRSVQDELPVPADSTSDDYGANSADTMTLEMPSVNQDGILGLENASTFPQLTLQAAQSAPLSSFYTCKKCRSELCDSLMLESEHVDTHDCPAFYLESPGPDWVSSRTKELQGKLLCPKCASRVGSWNWSGSMCSCGAWVVPSIQITKSKVDTKKRQA